MKDVQKLLVIYSNPVKNWERQSFVILKEE